MYSHHFLLLITINTPNLILIYLSHWIWFLNFETRELNSQSKRCIHPHRRIIFIWSSCKHIEKRKLKNFHLLEKKSSYLKIIEFVARKITSTKSSNVNSLGILTKGPIGNVESHGSVAMCLAESWQSCNAS